MLKSQHPLRLWRLVRQLSLQEVASALKISVPMLSEIENGRKFPSRHLAARLSKYTKIAVDKFEPNEQHWRSR